MLHKMYRAKQSSQKRPRGSPTFLTPTNPAKKRMPRRMLHNEETQSRGRRRILDFHSAPRSPVISSSSASTTNRRVYRGKSWTDSEVSALVEFVLFHSSGMKWPTHHQKDFWAAASSFVQIMSEHKLKNNDQASNSCRFKVVKGLKKRYEDPKAAGRALFPTRSVGTQTNSETVSTGSQANVECRSMYVQTSIEEVNTSNLQRSVISDISDISQSFSEHCKTTLELNVPVDFLTYASSAMVRLKKYKRSNVVYNLARIVGEQRADVGESRLPISRMPMGMIEYITNFFAADDLNEVPTCPVDYRSWLQTMYSHFGQKWARLHHGPMWSVATSYHTLNVHERSTMKALVNIPSLSERTIRRDTAAGNISVGPEIQLSVLDEAARVHPNEWWWIKADGADLVSGLGTSVKGIWSGDVDLGDGLLQKAYESHKRRIDFLSDLGGTRLVNLAEAVEQLAVVKAQITEDIDFVCSCLKDAAKKYSEKQAEKKSPEKLMFALAWDVEELQRLDQNGRALTVDCQCLADKVIDPNYDIVEDNLPKQFCSFKANTIKYADSVVKYRRTAATHVLVVMISPEQRNRKPYALPVQCMPYSSLGDEAVRCISEKLIIEMNKRGMKVAGFSTNGEWNSLRSKGKQRPISVFEIRSQVRRKYQRLGFKALVGMITPILASDGTIKSVVPNSVVSKELLLEVSNWIAEKCSMEDVIVRLRQRTVPTGYATHSWIKGREERNVERLKSILSQLDFTAQIKHFVSQGIPFDVHLHVPEVHQITRHVICQREDEGHLFKRIANSLRQGRMPDVGLERFVEALPDKEAGLTYPALTGIRKQSVQDVERLFGSGVIAFMEKHGYEEEAMLLKAVRNWRRAIDERGLTEHQRQDFLQEFMDYICCDLMPWYSKGLKDFSMLEVNRPVDNVRGFTAETLIGTVASIETRKWRYRFNADSGIPFENPRSSTTDDVECFFSILRDCVGLNFTLKRVYSEWRKIVTEFMKRMDDSLPFYYYTGNDRFYEEEMASFNVPSTKTKSDRLPRGELVTVELSRRASFPVRGSLSVRATFHAKPVYSPPLTSATSVQKIIAEHSYS